MKRKSIVYVVFPKTGLGNLLLIWSRASVFGHLNDLQVVTSAWWGIRWGSWARNERKKRLYWGCFRESTPGERIRAAIRKSVGPVKTEPAIARCQRHEMPAVFCFEKVATQHDLFGEIRPYRAWLKEEIRRLLKPSLQMQLDHLEAPEIAVHIRRGDFKLGNPITPNEFFIRCIEFVRAKTKRNLGVTVFTDADPGEIKDVLNMDGVRLADKKPDILDILQMSKSKILVLSRSSTFSYWAAFLSDAIVIKHSDDWQDSLRPEEVNRYRFEGKISFENSSTLRPLSKALENETW